MQINPFMIYKSFYPWSLLVIFMTSTWRWDLSKYLVIVHFSYSIISRITFSLKRTKLWERKEWSRCQILTYIFSIFTHSIVLNSQEAQNRKEILLQKGDFLFINRMTKLPYVYCTNECQVFVKVSFLQLIHQLLP